MRAPFRLQASAALLALLMPLVSAYAEENERDVTEESLRQDMHSLNEELRNFSSERREQLMADIKDVLDDIDTRLATLESRLEEEWNTVDRLARVQTQTELASMRRERARVKEWYERMQDSTGGTWESMKDSFNSAFDELSGAWQSAEQSVRETLEDN